MSPPIFIVMFSSNSGSCWYIIAVDWSVSVLIVLSGRISPTFKNARNSMAFASASVFPTNDGMATWSLDVFPFPSTISTVSPFCIKLFGSMMFPSYLKSSTRFLKLEGMYSILPTLSPKFFNRCKD